jgi:hypothetical protein
MLPHELFPMLSLILTLSIIQHLSHFNLMHEENSGGWYEPVQIVDHMINYTAGSHEMWWEVPVVKADSGYVLHASSHSLTINNVNRPKR